MGLPILLVVYQKMCLTCLSDDLAAEIEEDKIPVLPILRP